jgi:hypothetical protein
VLRPYVRRRFAFFADADLCYHAVESIEGLGIAF